MADGGGQPDLTTLQNTAAIAAQARQNEFNLYNQARSAGDLAGLTAHYQGYHAALQVEQKANAVLAQNLLNSPTLVSDLGMLAQANNQLTAAAAALTASTAALNQFTQAANAVLTVLGAIALL